MCVLVELVVIVTRLHGGLELPVVGRGMTEKVVRSVTAGCEGMLDTDSASMDLYGSERVLISLADELTKLRYA